MKKGILFVFSGPSGVGKGTVLKELFNKVENLEYSISATTRPPRDGEQNGKCYFFVTDQQLDKMIEDGEMLEHIEKYGNRYGTVKSYVNDLLNKGRDVILEIETIGAENVRKTELDQVSIFLTASSLKELNVRLNERNTEDKDKQQERLNLGREELKCAYTYDYIVINDNLHKAVDEIVAIIKAERQKVKRNRDIITKIIKGESL